MRKLFYHINRWGFAIKNYWIFSLRMKPYDYAFILDMMQHQLEILDRHMKRDAITEDHAVKERERVIEILSHINDSTYDYGYENWEDVARLEQQEWDELFDLLKAHMREWWD